MASVVVILSSLTGGTGNLTTAQRIADFVREGQRRDVRLRDCADFASPEELDTYLDGVGATLVIGVHMYRAGKLFSQRPRARILILGGTDINENVRDAAKMGVMQRAVALSAMVVAFSDTMCADFVKHFPNYDARSVRVIRPSVVVRAEGASAVSERVQLMVPSAPFVLLVTGMRDVKDPCFLLDDVGQRARETLLVVGPVLDDKCMQRFHTAAAPWHGRIVYGGEVSNAEVHYLMQRVNCSISEGLSNSLLEAMCLGCPVIARVNAGNCATIRHGVTGLLFDTPAEFIRQLERLTSDAPLRAQLIEQARADVASRFGVDAERAAYQECVAQLDP